MFAESCSHVWQTRDLHLPCNTLYLLSPRFCFFHSFDKCDDFYFDIVNFPFLDGQVPRRPSYGVYISQLIRFARVCSQKTLMLVINV